jgi:hypothetical protein
MGKSLAEFFHGLGNIIQNHNFAFDLPRFFTITHHPIRECLKQMILAG